MRALQIVGPGELAIKEVEIPQPSVGEALIKIEAAALNRRDHWIREGRYPGIEFGITLGSDGCGAVAQVGNNADQPWVGKPVLINPNIEWGDNPKCQAPGYQVLGMPTDGTLAEYIKVPTHRLIEKPSYLSMTEGAALPLAGLTAYRALFSHGKLLHGQNILITGIGGGVSQMMFVLANAVGTDISITSGSQEKLKKMLDLGASNAYNYHDEWARQALSDNVQFDLVVDSVGGSQLNELIKLVKPGGRVVFYGATTGLPPKLDLYRMFWNQITLQGSTMGNDQEFSEMVGFVEKHQIHPIIDSERPFEKVFEAFDRMRDAEQTGKLVVTFP